MLLATGDQALLGITALGKTHWELFVHPAV
jgi:hypothetical protein